jgi:hypothetical protein
MTALSLETCDHPALSASPRAPNRPRPAAPQPHAARLGPLATIRALRTNPITAFAEEAYCAPFLKIGQLRDIVLVNDPNEIEHVWSATPAIIARARSSSGGCGRRWAMGC